MSERGTTATTMVSDQDIAEALESLLRESNPNNTSITLDGVVQQLGSKLGFDLTPKTDFIRSHVQLLLRSQPSPPPFHHLPPPLLPKDHLALHPNPNLYHPPPSSHLPPHLPLHPHHHHHHHHHPDNFSLLQQPQPPPPPPPSVPKAESLVPATTSATPSLASAAPDAPKESAQAGKKRRGGPGGLNKLCGVSPELQAIVGQPALPRTEIVKQLWAYIRKNNLQDPSNKRKIICNDELRLVFETDCTDMFKMNKLLAKHIIPLEPTKQTGQNSKKLKVDVESVSESAESVPKVVLSEALVNFFGTGEKKMVQAKVIERVWDYINANHLVDPMNPMVIACDAKLQELFGCQSISALGVSDMLERHHLFRKS